MPRTRKPENAAGNADLRCSFCRRTQREVRKLIASPMGNKAKAYICDRCVRTFQNLVNDKKSDDGSRSSA